MTAHLAGKWRSGLRHLRLDKRMAGAPHEGRAAHARDLVEQHLARLDVGDDGCPRALADDVAGQHDHELIAPENAALLVDDANAIAVAVEGNAEVAALREH